MAVSEEVIKQALLGGSYVAEEDMIKADDYAEAYNTSVVDYLLSEGLLTKDLYGQAMAEYFELPYADLNSHMPSKEQVRRIPEDIAKKHRVVIFEEGDDHIIVSTDNPVDEQLKDILHSVLGVDKKITFEYSLSSDLDDVMSHYRTELSTRFAAIIEAEDRVAPEITSEIFSDAIMLRASDIHFEPHKEEVVVRFRIDGVMQEAGRIPKQYYDSMLNHIKVQAQLRIDQHFSPQDGAIRFNYKGADIDMRVSIAPVLDGEKVVIRLLSQYVRGFTLRDLGLSEEYEQMLEDASRKPFGMIMVTGPTGSGKSTTLYAVLKLLNRPDVNITTIEDPVEYRLEGINQMNVNPETDVTFASGLRSIVRQDPDIILVGEIRDQETAETAVNAALTGHLLLSTFHSNDAPTAIPRLLDMGTEPFLLSSTLEVVMAQRLVRSICQECRVSYTTTRKALESTIPNAKRYFDSTSTTLYRGSGCNNCNGTGYQGRTAIFEIIFVSPEMRDLILKRPSTQEIWKLAHKQGSRPLFEDGIEKVKAGVTTIEELLRVAKPTEEKK